MGDLDHSRMAILDTINGSQPWRALDRLPPPLSAGPDAAAPWEEASLADYFVVAEIVRTLFDKLVDDHVPPPDIEGASKVVWTKAHYNSESTVPAMVAADRLREACIQTSLLIYRRYLDRRDVVGQLSTAGLEDIYRHHRDSHLIQWLMAPNVQTNTKLHYLQALFDTVGAELSWYLLDLAVARWPADLTGRAALENFKIVSNYATPIMRRPELIALTDRKTWARLQNIAERVASMYGSMIRHELINAKAACGSNFVAIFDPTLALQVASVRAAVPWFDAVREKDNGAFEDAVKVYWRARTRWTLPDSLAKSGRETYTDFVMPVDGDGVWPGSVAEVEYLVRDMLVHGKVAAVETPQQVLSMSEGKWFWLQTPWVLPVDVLNVAGADEWHRRSPLLAWILHCSSNPFSTQNIFNGFDSAVRHLEKVTQSEIERKEIRELWRDVESVVLPTAIGTGVLALLFPGAPLYVLGACGAAIYPLVKLLRKRGGKEAE